MRRVQLVSENTRVLVAETWSDTTGACEVFQLRKFAPKHSDWKPFLAHLLGFDATLVAQHYEKEQALAKQQETAQTIKNELGGSIEDISKIEGILLLK